MAFNAASGDVFDYPHDYHLQVLVAIGDGQPYTVTFNELDDFRAQHPGSTYLYTVEPGKAQFRIPPDQAKFESRKGEPGIVVETYYRDDEWSIVGRYRVEGDSITPLYCRAWNRWLLITASLFFGLPLVPCVWLLGRCLKDSTMLKLAGLPAAYR
jgi:hypothetical protein